MMLGNFGDFYLNGKLMLFSFFFYIWEVFFSYGILLDLVLIIYLINIIRGYCYCFYIWCYKYKDEYDMVCMRGV